jgi:ribonuclease HI
MEVTAVLRGLQAIKQPSRVCLVSDSRYVVEAVAHRLAAWAASGWRTDSGQPTAHLDLWSEIYALIKTHDVEAIWVRGHAGHPDNRRVDKLAGEAARRFAANPFADGVLRP